MHFPGFLDVVEKNLLPKEGELEYVFPFYSESESQKFYDDLIHVTPWVQDDMKMYERFVLLPRLTASFGPDDVWPTSLMSMKADVEKHAQMPFNRVHMNLYRDQRDHVSWHADRETVKGDTDIIVSISLGETRKFQVKHKTDKSIPVITLELKPGSLVIMKGGMQKNWLHRIAQETKSKGPRINLTFRRTSPLI